MRIDGVVVADTSTVAAVRDRPAVRYYLPAVDVRWAVVGPTASRGPGRGRSNSTPAVGRPAGESAVVLPRAAGRAAGVGGLVAFYEPGDAPGRPARLTPLPGWPSGRHGGTCPLADRRPAGYS